MEDDSTESYTTDNPEENMTKDVDMMEDDSKESENILEETIMSWTKREQQQYLKTIKLPIYGTKNDLMSRIMTKIPIKDAVEFTREYKRKQYEENENDTDGKGSKNKEKEKMDIDMEKMEIVLKRKREENGTQIPNKINVQDDIRAMTNTQQEGSEEDDEATNTSDNNSEEEDSTGGDSDEDKEEGVEVIKITKGKQNQGMREDQESVATTKVDNVKRTRIGLMLTLPSSKEPDKTLVLQITKWFNKMKEMDEKFTVISWRKQDGPKYPLKNPKNIPDTISKLRVYFARVQARSAGGKVYADVFIQHTIPLDDIRGDAEWFLKENQMAMYGKQLQVESTVQKGWLLYSTQSMDIDTLAEVIFVEIGVVVALRWKFINSSKYIENEDERKKWMALHIEVDAKEEKRASRGLKKLYGSQSQKFPLGIRMRLVSEFREVRGNTVMMGKHARLRVRQASFLSSIEGYPSDDIQMLDYEDNGVTLRELMMSIQSRNEQTPGNLFHSVGKDWRGRIIINFLRSKSDEACMIIDGLIPYLQYEHGDAVNLFFDPEAVLEKEKWEWNDEKGTIINPLSKELDGLEAIDEDYDFTVAGNEDDKSNSNKSSNIEPNEIHKESAEERALARLNMVVTGEDTDSVSTLGNPVTPASIQRARLSGMIPIRTAQSGTSSITDSSMSSRMSAIEKRIMTMEETITQSLENSMTKIIEKMKSPNATSITNQPPGGESAGSGNE